jgi:hypothetical protein
MRAPDGLGSGIVQLVVVVIGSSVDEPRRCALCGKFGNVRDRLPAASAAPVVAFRSAVPQPRVSRKYTAYGKVCSSACRTSSVIAGNWCGRSRTRLNVRSRSPQGNPRSASAVPRRSPRKTPVRRTVGQRTSKWLRVSRPPIATCDRDPRQRRPDPVWTIPTRSERPEYWFQSVARNHRYPFEPESFDLIVSRFGVMVLRRIRSRHSRTRGAPRATAASGE